MYRWRSSSKNTSLPSALYWLGDISSGLVGYALADSRKRKSPGNCPAICNSGSFRERDYPYAFFFTNIALMLSNSSILAPCLRMIRLCCATDSELFQAQ